MEIGKRNTNQKTASIRELLGIPDLKGVVWASNLKINYTIRWLEHSAMASPVPICELGQIGGLIQWKSSLQHERGLKSAA